MERMLFPFAKLIGGNRRLKWRNGKRHSVMLLNSLDSDLLITMGEAAATFQTHKYPSQFQLTYQSFRKKIPNQVLAAMPKLG
jgi:hypothetical protein